MHEKGKNYDDYAIDQSYGIKIYNKLKISK